MIKIYKEKMIHFLPYFAIQDNKFIQIYSSTFFNDPNIFKTFGEFCEDSECELKYSLIYLENSEQLIMQSELVLEVENIKDIIDYKNFKNNFPEIYL